MASKTKVAVLDDYQSLSTAPFSHFDLSSFDITTFRDALPPFAHASTTSAQREQVVGTLADYPIICAMRERTPFPAELIRRLPKLKLVLTTAMRNKGLDLDAFRAAGVAVHGAPGHGRSDAAEVIADGPDSTTQHCVALILGVVRNLAADDANVKAGRWQENVTVGLAGRTLGCVGFGRLGMAIARIMTVAFGMRVLAWSSSLTLEQCAEKAVKCGLPSDAFKCVSKEDVFGADVVSLHYVLSERSRGLVGAKELAWMKKDAFFVNTSRGPLVDEEALLRVLKEGRIRGAAVDVFDLEPLNTDSEWRTTKWGQDGRSHVLLSPHMGYVEVDTMRRWYEETAENLVRYAAGKELANSML